MADLGYFALIDWIPTYLSPITQMELRSVMRSDQNMKDKDGYIYTYEIRGMHSLIPLINDLTPAIQKKT
jgi:hypothetical protein